MKHLTGWGLITLSLLIGCHQAETAIIEEMPVSTETPAITQTAAAAIPAEEEEEKDMKLLVNGTEIPVIWEENASVEELLSITLQEPINVSLSMYAGNEQFGALGHTITSNDTRLTSTCGDIFLYESDQIVLFYGSNTWAYTRLGKIDLSDAEITELLSQGDVEITLCTEE